MFTGMTPVVTKLINTLNAAQTQ